MNAAGEKDAVKIKELELPEKARAVYFYRGEMFFFAERDTTLKKENEVVILTHSRHLPELNERWEPRQLKDDS